MRLKAISDQMGVRSVADEGAIGDYATNNLAAFQRAAARCLTRSSVILVPEIAPSGVPTPGYLLSGNYLGSLGTAGDATPGGVTRLYGRIIYETGPMILPSGHMVLGHSTNYNDASPVGGEIWADDGGYTGTGNRLVQIGASPSLPAGTRLENITINGRNVPNIIGVYSNTAQERCGVRDCVINNCESGIVFEYGCANFSIENTHVILTDSSPTDGMNINGRNYRITKCTAVNTHATTVGNAGFVLHGNSATLEDCHFEGFAYGVVIGGSGVGLTNNINICRLTGYNGAVQPALTAAVHIRNTESHVFNIDIRDISLNAFNSAQNLILDDVNGIRIPAASNNLDLGYYRFDGTQANDSWTARPVYTSYYNHLGAPNNAVKAAAVTGTTNDLATTFASGAHAGILQTTSTSTPVLTSLANGRTGRVVYGHNLSGSTLVLDHAAGTGTAANRLLCSTGADINIAVGSYFRATYGDILGAAIDATNYASRWYVEAI